MYAENSETLTVRKATVEDAETLLTIQRSAYQVEAELYQDWTIAPLTETLEELQHDIETITVLVGETGGRIVGSVRGALDFQKVCHIGRLVVDPQYQGHGYGQQLLLAIESEFPQAKAFTLFTGHQSVRNLHVYQKLGYYETSRQFIKRKLTFVHLRKDR